MAHPHQHDASGAPPRGDGDGIEMPRPTAAPLVLAVAIVLAAGGVATGTAFIAVGGALAVAGLGLWIGQLVGGRGHAIEPLVAPADRARAPLPAPFRVQSLRPGMPGYRLRLPERVHPISAGIKGGMAGGLVMPLPAMLYGIVSGQGIWLPVNLLAGLLLPGVDQMDLAELKQFNPTLLVIGASIHVTVSLVFGLLYGVLLPTLPTIAKPLAWGALLFPLLWSAVSFFLVSESSPTVRAEIDWPWFIVSQFIFGIATATVVMRSDGRHPLMAGLRGGIVAGILMVIPAVAWGVLSGHGPWYPINLLSGMLRPAADELTVAQLETFQPRWLALASVLHAALSISFGMVYGLLLARLPQIPGPLAWGALVMPLLWTATSYGFMGVVNPVLQQRVDWPWFVASQFVFGLVAAIVVVRSQMVHIPPAGQGSEDTPSPAQH
jgi:hypothetical protein